MVAHQYGITDFEYIAAGAAILASGGGGSYEDAVSILSEIAKSGWRGTVTVQDYDGVTDCCVLAIMGSPDAANQMTLAEIEYAIANTLNTFKSSVDVMPGCIIPVEIGPINSIVPLIAAMMERRLWVMNGDGAGRAVPELPQTTYAGNVNLPATLCVLANSAENDALLQSAVLNAPTAAVTETLAGGIVSAFGSYSGIALWPSNVANGHALQGSYISGTLTQAWQIGQYLITAPALPSTADVVAKINTVTRRQTIAIITNFYITAVTQSTSSTSLDVGLIRLDNAPSQADGTESYYLYNLNENLIMYSSVSNAPLIVAPDSICYYSESTGRGFSNAICDLAVYFDFSNATSTGKVISIIKVAAAPQLCEAAGVIESFAGLLRGIGYAGKLPRS
ncbi:hypothetical protein SAMN05428977_10129 [Nitrosomonas sp. Nm166]|nr:hypothetical protein SAMN05428977_10129 [Nitrosomonas sp. Nm166]